MRIFEDILVWLEGLVQPIERIARHDPDLARQLRRASRSVGLNAAEGSAASGRSRTACYRIALREARESHAALLIAERLGYIQPLPAAQADRMQKIIATLVRLAYPRAG